MLALIAIGATSEKVHRRGGLAKYVLPQFAVLLIVGVLGVFGEHLYPVALVGGLLLASVGLTILSQRESV